MEIKIDQAAIQEVVKSAIMEQLGAEGREKLISQALEFLLTAPAKRSVYDPNPVSPLQAAFNDAARDAAKQIVRDQVATDEVFKARIHQKVGEAMSLVDEANYSFYVAEALGEALKKAKGY